MLAWLRLVRVPNLATAAADPLAGYLIVSGLREVGWPPAACWLAVAAVVAIYAAGMVLNDVCDLELDREERPERPLPSGAVSVGTAATVGAALLVGGVALSVAAAVAAASLWPAVVGGILAAAVWLYDRFAKGTPAGPLVMGSCRALAWLMGMTAAGGPTQPAEWLVPAGMGTYVAGITLFARHEATAAGDEAPPAGTGGAEVAAVRIGAAVMAAGLALASGPVWRRFATGARLPGTPLDAGTWLILWSIIAASILARALPAVVAPAPARIRPAVGNAILSIITLDAILVLAECGERWALAILALLIPAVVGRRIVPPT